ncbi:hypothetical protein RHDC3_02494 [Rhodocyclaceae bacterium]|nr:hypothetical protein RHDC3_02494 [Rhodocyclaceae bacterium]
MVRAAVVTLATLLLLLEASQASAETLTVSVTGLRGVKGTLFVTVWNDEARFLKDVRHAAARRVVPVSGPEMTVVVEGLPRGVYAVTAFQDENGNGELDRSFIGLPKEPVGASNDARGMMGPPKFKAAAFELSGPSRSIPIRLR